MIKIEPIYEKHPPQAHLDYHHMTWETFLTIREFAQELANKEGYPVYLVGSVLYKSHPRDIDISIIMPVDKYEERFGKIPDDKEELKTYLCKMGAATIKYFAVLQDRLRWITRTDIKITPDTWHNHQDKMLLAIPNGKVVLRQYDFLD